MISTVNHITNTSVETAIEDDYRSEWPIVVTCYLQSLIFIMLGHMGETHTDGIPVKFIRLFDFDISA